MDGSCTDLPAAARVEEIRSPRDCATSLAAFTRRAYTQEGFGQESNDVHTQCKPKCVKQQQHRGVHTTALDAILGHPRYVTHLSQTLYAKYAHTYVPYVFVCTYVPYVFVCTYVPYVFVCTYVPYVFVCTYIPYVFVCTYILFLMYLYTLLLTNQPT